ncbi:MAG: Spy/CpxP family protein refolding chaperone [Xanthobacteraceae bacterium]|nr:Spy/CpxP family protein refolding chaperone [Xanthobacteraceae bacterium]
MPHPRKRTFLSTTAPLRAGAKHQQRWNAVLSGLILVAALQGPALARPGSGYGDLIDSYCIERGRLRVGAHQGHCAACHQPGTFDSTPGHRVEPNWTEFERGRATGLFDFFCPALSVPASTPPAAAPSPGSPSWLPPSREPAAMGAPPAVSSAVPPSDQRQPPAVPQPASGAAVPAADLAGRLSALRTALRITASQEPAWREFADAVVAAAQRRPSAPGTAAPAARLRARELDLSERIVALRAVNRALSRLGAKLDDTQRRLLSDDFAPLLDII